MNVLLAWLPLIFGAYYLVSSGRNTFREVAVMVVWVMAAGPLLDGVVLLHEANARWHDGRDVAPFLRRALPNLTIGALLVLVAGFLSGRLRWATPKYITVPGIVTSVEPIPAGGKVHWRIAFAYFSPDGVAYESLDEVYVAGLQPGDSCTVVYPPEQPDLGTLRGISKPSIGVSEPASDLQARSTDRMAG